MASLTDILPYARYYARETGVRQVLYHNPRTNDYGRVPLPEWNQKHAHRRSLRVVRVVKPGD